MLIRDDNVEYFEGEKRLRGFLARDDSFIGKRPGIVLFHDIWGFGSQVVEWSEDLAKHGFVALAADIFGDRRKPENVPDGMAILNSFKADAQLWRARALAALNSLAAQPHVDSTKLAAVGFCFGGSTVLELARTGADFSAAVCFHGSLAAAASHDAPIKAKILIGTGADDPIVPLTQCEDFKKEMKGEVDWQIVIYGLARHSFTDPDAGRANLPHTVYHEPTKRRAWNAMMDLFDEIFGKNIQ